MVQCRPKGFEPSTPIEIMTDHKPVASPKKPLSPEARRALEEAAERRAAIDARAAELAKSKEHRGRGGLEPVRYEDWEVKGLASDF